MDKKEIFIEAIQGKKIVKVKVNSYEKGIIERYCIPYDYGISRIYKDGKNRFHFYDLDSPDGEHNLSILPEQLIEIEITEDLFEPKDYVTWNPPYKWFIERDWGEYS